MADCNCPSCRQEIEEKRDSDRIMLFFVIALAGFLSACAWALFG